MMSVSRKPSAKKQYTSENSGPSNNSHLSKQPGSPTTSHGNLLRCLSSSSSSSIRMNSKPADLKFTKIGLEQKKVDIQARLYNALEYVRHVCVFGANNKIDDIVKTADWVSFHQPRYHILGKYVKLKKDEWITDETFKLHRVFRQEDDKPITHNIKSWYYQPDPGKNSNEIQLYPFPRFNLHPLGDKQFNLDQAHATLLIAALLVAEKRQGNCGDRSRVLMKYLWENSSGIDRIECIRTSTFDHVFVIVNRDSGSHLNHPESWGDAWVIDSWVGEGVIFHAKDFRNKIKEIKHFAILQKDELKKIDLNVPDVSDIKDEKETLSCVHEVIPKTHRYPTYSTDDPFLPIEYYYYTANSLPTEFTKEGKDVSMMREYERLHKLAFKETLNSIRKEQKIDSGSVNLFPMTINQVNLLERVKNNYKHHSLWKYWEGEKIAALVDIYGGAFPKVYKKDDRLFREYSEKLISYCERYGKLFPETRVSNEILDKYRASLNAEKSKNDTPKTEAIKETFLSLYKVNRFSK